jgi:hypothetical protein
MIMAPSTPALTPDTDIGATPSRVWTVDGVRLGESLTGSVGDHDRDAPAPAPSPQHATGSGSTRQEHECPDVRDDHDA